MALVELTGDEIDFVLANTTVMDETELALKACAGKEGYHQVEFDSMDASLAIGDLIHLAKSTNNNGKLMFIDGICDVLERAL